MDNPILFRGAELSISIVSFSYIEVKHYSYLTCCSLFLFFFLFFFFVIFKLSLSFFTTEKPAEQSSAGLLRLDTNISRRYYIYFSGAKHLGIRFVDYSMIVATLPEPTVLPPSRIAKRRPCSIATGWISSIVISTLSPGMHISVPSGSSQTPVTSVVLK